MDDDTEFARSYRRPVRQATVKIVFSDGAICSGTLLNRKTDDNNLGFYLLTAKHCTNDVDFDAEHDLYFNYQSPEGNSESTPGTNRGITPDQSGVNFSNPSVFNYDGYEYLHKTKLRLIADFFWGDFALVEILTPVPPHFNVLFSGWNPSLFYNGIEIGTPHVPFESFIGFHHPRGDIKKLSTAPYIHWNENPIATDCYTLTTIIDVLFGWIWGHQISTQVICNWMDNPWLTVLGWHYGTTEPGSSGSGLFNRNNRQIGVLTAGLANCNVNIFDNYGKFRSNYFRASIKNALNPDHDLGTDLVGLDSRKITCYDNLELPGALGVSGHYFPANHYQETNLIALNATNNITTTQPIRVYEGADYRLGAGGTIDIGPGFEAVAGSYVDMYIGGCITYKKPDITSKIVAALGSITLPKTKSLDLHAIISGTVNMNESDKAPMVLQLFPNPAKDVVHIRLSETATYLLKVLSPLGVVVYSNIIENERSGTLTLHLPPGPYYVMATSRQGSVSGKLIIE